MRRLSGFSLIELLIVISISTILVTLGFNAYTKGKLQADINSTNDQLKNILNQTHQLALIGKKPNNCLGIFQGYQLQITSTTNTITITPLCSHANGSPTNYSLNNLLFKDNISLNYKPLLGGVDLNKAEFINIDYSDINQSTHRIRIYKSGDYTDLGIIE